MPAIHDWTKPVADIKKIAKPGDLYKINCLRCGGSGQTKWKHVEGGICFKCNGSGYNLVRS